METWRPISGYLGAYEASSEGRVRSLTRVTDRGRKWKGRILTPATMSNGYQIVSLWRDGSQRSALVHRLVLLAFSGEPEEGQEARHLNGDRVDNRPENLKWGTHAENQLDQVAHGNHHRAAKTHCPQGHPYSGDNLYAYPGKPHRMCRTCRREYQREYQRNLRATKRKAA